MRAKLMMSLVVSILGDVNMKKYKNKFEIIKTLTCDQKFSLLETQTYFLMEMMHYGDAKLSPMSLYYLEQIGDILKSLGRYDTDEIDRFYKRIEEKSDKKDNTKKNC